MLFYNKVERKRLLGWSAWWTVSSRQKNFRRRNGLLWNLNTRYEWAHNPINHISSSCWYSGHYDSLRDELVPWVTLLVNDWLIQSLNFMLPRFFRRSLINTRHWPKQMLSRSCFAMSLNNINLSVIFENAIFFRTKSCFFEISWQFTLNPKHLGPWSSVGFPTPWRTALHLLALSSSRPLLLHLRNHLNYRLPLMTASPYSQSQLWRVLVAGIWSRIKMSKMTT